MPAIGYEHPAHVRPLRAERPLLSTADGGSVAIDEELLSLWCAASGRTLHAICSDGPRPGPLEGIVPEALACLAEARLLARWPDAPAPLVPIRSVIGAPAVSAVIVASVPSELEPLDDCLRSLAQQRYRVVPLIVDNAVGCDVATWAASHRHAVNVLSLPVRGTYAAALNAGIDAVSQSSYLLLLNADVQLHPAAVNNLVARIQENDGCAAVAPKLRFRRAPAFLNGLGNRVPPTGWGTDNGIGQLDLGQFDDWRNVPSGCLTALLVSRAAWTDVGRFDERYPAYYEDADWCYRARVLGYRIGAAPDAEVLHVFGTSWAASSADDLPAPKLATAVAGRARFTMKIPAAPLRRRLIVNYAREDLRNYAGAIRRGRRDVRRAYEAAGRMVLRDLLEVAAARRQLQHRRRCSDGEIFTPESTMPASMTWRNVPELTSAAIRDYYAPLICAGKTRPLCEMESAAMRL